MKKQLANGLTLLALFLLLPLGLKAADTHGTQVTVKVGEGGGGLVCVKNCTTTRSWLGKYTHKDPADPTDAEYVSDALTIKWSSPGGGTSCEVKCYIYAQPLPGYKFVEWRQNANIISQNTKHALTLTHSTKLPNYNGSGYTYTAIFVQDNPVTTEVYPPVGSITLSPEVPIKGQPVTASITANKVKSASKRMS